jgi:hypothetical protein
VNSWKNKNEKNTVLEVGTFGLDHLTRGKSGCPSRPAYCIRPCTCTRSCLPCSSSSGCTSPACRIHWHLCMHVNIQSRFLISTPERKKTEALFRIWFFFFWGNICETKGLFVERRKETRLGLLRSLFKTINATIGLFGCPPTIVKSQPQLLKT